MEEILNESERKVQEYKNKFDNLQTSDVKTKVEYFEGIAQENNPKDKKITNAKDDLFVSKDASNKNKPGGKNIFESDYAKGDLSSLVKFKDSKCNIDEIIKIGKQVLKSLKIIHDAGYSHNDLKPDNLFIVEKQSKQIDLITGKHKKKDCVQLADFGEMTEINNTKKIFLNSQFHAPDWYKTDPESVGKRDIYALGAVLLYLIVKDPSIKAGKRLARALNSQGVDKFYDIYHLNKYGTKASKKIKNLLSLISNMVKPSAKDRIEIELALVEIKKI